jgi:hypothetical protein
MITKDARLYEVSGNIARMYAGATGRDLHIDAVLSNITIGFRPTGFIADQVMPVVNVSKETDFYYTWPREEWFRLKNAERSRGTAAKKINTTVSTDTYAVKNYALGIDAPYEDIANADEALELQTNNSNLIKDSLMLNWEDRLAVLIGNTANHGASTTLAQNYSNQANTDPVGDIDTGLETIRSGTGMEANVMIVSMPAWRRLRRHPNIIEYIRGKGDSVGGGGVTAQQLGNAFEISKVLIGRGIKNTAAEGAAGSYTDIWSNHIILLHVAGSPGRMTPTYGYTFQWTPAGFPAPFTVRRLDDDRNMVETMEVHHFQDEKVCSTALGYIIVGA